MLDTIIFYNNTLYCNVGFTHFEVQTCTSDIQKSCQTMYNKDLFTHNPFFCMHILHQVNAIDLCILHMLTDIDLLCCKQRGCLRK